MIRSLFVAVAVVTLASAMSACGTSKPRKERGAVPVPPMEDAKAAGPVDAYLDDVKKSVAEQLECPLDQVNVVCTRRDAQDECVAVRGDGCGRTLEYQFGDVTDG